MTKNKLQEEINNLNEQQKLAVTYDQGAMFVVAGAGTGKTKTLTTRIAHLILEQGVDPNRVLALSFTNEAAAEVMKRVNKLIYPKKAGAWFCTIHSFGNRILKEYIEQTDFGYKSNYRILNKWRTYRFVEKIVVALNFKGKVPETAELVAQLSDHKMGIQDSSEDLYFMHFYNEYQKLLISNQAMDYDDLIIYTKKILEEYENIREDVSNKFTNILIDEFQDTDHLQYEIIKMLNKKNTFVVGDPDQSIYSFRGARYKNNVLFLKEFEPKKINLTNNYRSTQTILEAANNLISHNENQGLRSDLNSTTSKGERIVELMSRNPYDQADKIAIEINKLIEENNYIYKDFAVIFRNNSEKAILERQFNLNKIPISTQDGKSFFDNKTVVKIIDYIGLIANVNDNTLFKKVYTNRLSSVVDSVLLNVYKDAANKKVSVYNLLNNEYIYTIEKNDLKIFIDELNELINHFISEPDLSSLIDLIDDLITPKTNKNYLKNDHEQIIQEVKEYFNVSFDSNNKNKSVNNLIEDIKVITDFTTNADTNSVTLGTIHNVKGLEFTVVFVISLVEGVIPDYRTLKEQSLIEEERRLFYVAITRAKERLYLMYTQKTENWAKDNSNEPSRFLREIKRNLNEDLKTTTYQNYLKTNNNYEVDDVIEHGVYGKGKIVEVNKNIITVNFEKDNVTKKLDGNHKSIKKVN